nr:MAG TPA: hypothetical protein [Caudoviricetes sp.]
MLTFSAVTENCVRGSRYLEKWIFRCRNLRI